ncbi:MAG TPA: sulfatase-like hydrolase/transferase [Acidimicrobiia bacterium]|nr:sulfatase-like hydrolase/transferase [Acidimicrobiia bacterium]
MEISRTVTTFEVFASCVAFLCLAVSQPILDLLGRNPEFFLARSSPALDVVLVGVVLGLVAPVLTGLLVAGIHHLNLAVGTAIHIVVLGLSGTVLFVDVLERFVVGSPLLVAIACMVGAAIVLLFYGSFTFRTVTKYVAFAPLVVMMSFATLSPLSRLLFAADRVESDAVTAEVGNEVPIVIVVFDEFPLASLIDANGEIQSSNYPNFARLAADSLWLRNAVTNESITERALPMILTGNRAQPEAIPALGDYPDNLFTLLEGTYEIRATEDLTDLCPSSACSSLEPSTWQERWRGMASDLRIVALHVLLPSTMTAGLAPIDQSWADFDEQQLDVSASDETAEFSERFAEVSQEGREHQFAEFLDSIAPAEAQPTLDFIHLLLPHSPWEFLPDGRRHWSPQPARGTNGPGWVDDPWLVHQIYQRHLLQVQYTDTLVGMLLDRLRALEVYDESLIVVVADHGIAFTPGTDHRRRLTRETIGEMVAVPLFIKPPTGHPTGIDDYRAELIDIVPTVADIIDVDLPWPTEGVSLLEADRPAREESVINQRSKPLVIGIDGQEKLEVAREKIAIFGSGSPYGLVPSGTRDLLETPLSDLDIESSAPFDGEVSNPLRYQEFDPDAVIIPAYVQGVLGRTVNDEPVRIAVAVNDVISAVTQSYIRAGQVLFQALLPPTAFVAGSNDIKLIYVAGDEDQLELSFIDLSPAAPSTS